MAWHCTGLIRLVTVLEYISWSLAISKRHQEVAWETGDKMYMSEENCLLSSHHYGYVLASQNIVQIYCFCCSCSFSCCYDDMTSLFFLKPSRINYPQQQRKFQCKKERKPFLFILSSSVRPVLQHMRTHLSLTLELLDSKLIIPIVAMTLALAWLWWLKGCKGISSHLCIPRCCEGPTRNNKNHCRAEIRNYLPEIIVK